MIINDLAFLQSLELTSEASICLIQNNDKLYQQKFNSALICMMYIALICMMTVHVALICVMS